MEKDSASAVRVSPRWSMRARPLPRSYLNYMGRRLIRLGQVVRELGAFTLITLGVAFTKWNTASRIIHPLIRAQIRAAGVRLLPITAFLGLALGFVIISQTVGLLTRVGAQEYIGTAMVTIVVRELGPLVMALLVLARVGTATVIELGTRRANGEVEALEALGIDPIHYLVMPRVFGLAMSIFALTVYFIMIALFSGYLFAFIQDAASTPGEYVRQIATALRWEDFVLISLKTFFFGAVIALVTCYEGLAKPLRQEDVAEATTRAVVQSVELCVLLDAVFISYLLL